MKIGEKLKELRIERGWSQEQVATRLGYKSRSTINKIEMGKNDITQSTIFAFAKLFRIEPGDLINDEPLDIDEIRQKWDEEAQAANLDKKVKIYDYLKEFYGDTYVKLLETFNKLNAEGKTKALQQLEDLTDVPKYRKEESP